jgi:hypothetical protein
VAEQIAALAELLNGPNLQQSHWSVLAPPTAVDVNALAQYMVEDALKRSLLGWLCI